MSGLLGGAAKMGGLALLGGLAAQLLGGRSDAPSPQQAAQNMAQLSEPEAERVAQIIIKAMVNAAKADGQVTEDELRKIVDRLDDDGLSADEKAFIQAELQGPFDLEGLVAAVGNDQMLAAQVYTASMMAIDVDTVAEQQYLQTLAQRLGLSDVLR